MYTIPGPHLLAFYGVLEMDTSSAEFPTHSYLAPGYYDMCLTITDSLNCSSTFCDSAFYAFKLGGGPMTQLNSFSGQGHTGGQISTAIQNTASGNLSFTVYPNPANDELTISTTAGRLDRVTIYNTQGQKVSEVEAPALNKINIQSLADGMYFINVNAQGASGKVKFVKAN
jgi:hypothetical protein